MPPKQREYVVDVKDDEQFLSFISSENKKLVVVDLFPKWSGPCTLMQSTYKELAMGIEDFDKRVDIINVSIEIISSLKLEKIAKEIGSKPRFLFYMEGKQIDEVHGADSPSLAERVHKYLPMVY